MQGSGSVLRSPHLCHILMASLRTKAGMGQRCRKADFSREAVECIGSTEEAEFGALGAGFGALGPGFGALGLPGSKASVL